MLFVVTILIYTKVLLHTLYKKTLDLGHLEQIIVKIFFKYTVKFQIKAAMKVETLDNLDI